MSREIAKKIAARHGPAVGDGQALADAIESALADAFARGRAAGEADMRESLDSYLTALARRIRALPLSAPAKQEGSDE